jgi:TldD protein
VAPTRREFLKTSSAAAAAVGLGACTTSRAAPTPAASPTPSAPTAANATASIAHGEPDTKELAMLALDAAKSAGAEYADVRISRNRNQQISARERRIQTLVDNETSGFGVRTLVAGAWGFAASQALSREEVVRVARQAVDQARANRAALLRPVSLAPVTPTPDGRWRSPARQDPFDVAIDDKAAMLLAANAAALQVAGARFVTSAMFFLREEKTLATSDGTYVVQTIYRAQPSLNVTAVSADRTDFQSRDASIPPMGIGYEHILAADLVGNAPKWAGEAVQKLSAKSIDVGRYDLVLHPDHLWLTIHESIAHPTELDRA